MSNDASETSLRLERFIPSPPDMLFAFWMEPAQLARWWAPDGYEPTVHALDTRPGGRWRIAMRSSDGRAVVMSGVYSVVEPPRRLAFTWAWEDERGARGHETEVTVSFDAAPGGTRLVLTQQRFESARARDGHHAGWSSAIERLTKIAG